MQDGAPPRPHVLSTAGNSASAVLDQVSRDTLLAITRNLTLAQIERIVIEDRITLHTYRKAAQTLGISQTTIYNRQLKWKAGRGE